MKKKSDEIFHFPSFLTKKLKKIVAKSEILSDGVIRGREKELIMRKNRTAFIQAVKDFSAGAISCRCAALRSGYSTAQIRRKSKELAIYGEACFIHRNTGRKPSTTIAPNARRKIVKIYQDEFNGVNFSFFAECLTEFYDISLSPRTVYNILTEAGIISPENRKTKKPDIHRPRRRRDCEGEMLQIDATPYQWFSWCGDNQYYALHGSVDDATGKITALYMCENECLYGYAELIRRTFFNYNGGKGGHPSSVYSDRAAIFCVNPKDKDKLTIAEQLKAVHEKRTQWQRILDEVGVEQILAWSPQAKGRVERMWRTVQGRLPWLFRRYKIRTLEEANQFLLQYVEDYNQRFAVTPRISTPVWHKTGGDPDYILAARYERTLKNTEFFSFEGYKWEIIGAKFRRCKFELVVNEHGIRAWKNGKFYEVQLADEFYGETTTQVLERIIYKYYLKDMKEIAA